MPKVGYFGKQFNTIQVFSQCWLKENLNVGEMIDGTMDQSNNGTLEKYCYNNEPDSCTKYGGLYQWPEMMQYTTQQGTQGICPPGWHLPTDEEWKVLEGAVDSRYGIGDPEWDLPDEFRGYDAGTNLKSNDGWNNNGNGTDLYAFSGLPGGILNIDSFFSYLGRSGYWWTSYEFSSYNSCSRSLHYDYHEVYRYNTIKEKGISVRCIRDENMKNNLELKFTAVNNNSYVRLDSIKVINRNDGCNTLLFWPDTILFVPYELPFFLGDELLIIGFADNFESGIVNAPEVSQTYTFQFATNIPCPGTPTVEYAGQVYNTIQVFSQCWLKENLNVGEMIPGTMEQSNNGTIEKYCYKDEPDSCSKYGGLYQWDEMMHYANQQGTQGICPPGWHLPTDEEWKWLEGAVDSQYGILDPEWDYSYGYRGFDAGTNLKTTSGWSGNGDGTDLFGFSGLPGGLRYYYGGYLINVGYDSYWWLSNDYGTGHAQYRNLDFSHPGVFRSSHEKDYGFSVRCLRDY
jgi:uncharacterized protein (TIGR02145 family)